MLRLLCVDGLDINKVSELNLNMEYNYKLEIPKGCYVYESGAYHPHTYNIWSSMFIGKVMNKDIRPDKNISLLKKVENGIYKLGRKLKDDKFVRYPYSFPYYIHHNNVFKKFNSFNWNIPTISIDYTIMNSKWMNMFDYCFREMEMFKNLLMGSEYTNFELYAVYTRILDYFGHNLMNTDRYYKHIFYIAKLMSIKGKIMLISDHGTKYEDGYHTESSYLGTNFKVDAKSILDIRKIIEECLK